MNQDNFDWAALAQQWIQKNTSCISSSSSSDMMPEPPPPPIISGNYSSLTKINEKIYEEQGEADMEVVKEDEDQPSNSHLNYIQIEPTPPPPPPPLICGNVTTNILQPVWFGNQPAPQIPFNNSWNQWQTIGNVGLSVPQPPLYNIPPVQQINIARENITNVLPIPPLMKPTITLDEKTPPVIDAAKRKTLPAWIREGLEKMEREKLKQIEKIPSTSNATHMTRFDIDDKKYFGTTVGSNTIKSSFDVINIVKSSATDSDSDSSLPDAKDLLKSKYVQKKESPTAEPIKKNLLRTYEEIITDLMLVVRRSLTEVLLEVTNEEINTISSETFKKHKLKASSAQVFRKSAISSITGKLGLGAYADSASSDDDNDSDHSDADDDNGKNSEQEIDSEAEIRETIRIRQNSFKAIALEIDRLADEDNARNENKLKEQRSTTERLQKFSGGVGNLQNSSSTSSTTTRKFGYDRDIGEAQQSDKKTFTNGKRPKERTSRFSDNKDSRQKTASSSSSSSHYLVAGVGNVINVKPPTTSSTASTNILLPNSAGSSGKKLETIPKTTVTTIPPDDDKPKEKIMKRRMSSSSTTSTSTSSSKSSSDIRHRRRNRHDSDYSKDRKRKRTTSTTKSSTSKDDRSSSASINIKKPNSSHNTGSGKSNSVSNSSSRRKHDNLNESSDSADDYHRRRNRNSTRSRVDRSRSKSRSKSIRSRSRSRSRSSYSSSKRYGRY